jgi:hypothetical protein
LLRIGRCYWIPFLFVLKYINNTIFLYPCRFIPSPQEALPGKGVGVAAFQRSIRRGLFIVPHISSTMAAVDLPYRPGVGYRMGKSTCGHRRTGG